MRKNYEILTMSGEIIKLKDVILSIEPDSKLPYFIFDLSESAKKERRCDCQAIDAGKVLGLREIKREKMFYGGLASAKRIP